MNIIITGASSGIGFETALRFSNDEKNKVIAISRDKEKLKLLAETSIKQNAKSHLIPLAYDISPENNSENLYSLVKKEIDSVDILINNAGAMTDKKRTNPDNYDYSFVSNYLGGFLLTQLLLLLVISERM